MPTLAQAPSPPLLAAENLTAGFGRKVVLEHVNLTVSRGESLVVMGPSGVGKTVLLKHLIGLSRPLGGKVLVDGVELWSLPARERVRVRQRFGIAFQDAALFDSLSVFENVAFPLRRHSQLGEEAIRQRVEACLQMVRLRLTGDETTSQLSTGMRRRVGFARAIAREPEILLFDEPTAGLDPVMVTVMSEVISSLNRRLRPATVTVTHDLTFARRVADRIALLVRGHLVAQAPRDEFFELSHPAVRQFLEGRVDGPILASEELGT